MANLLYLCMYVSVYVGIHRPHVHHITRKRNAQTHYVKLLLITVYIKEIKSVLSSNQGEIVIVMGGKQKLQKKEK